MNTHDVWLKIEGGRLRLDDVVEFHIGERYLSDTDERLIVRTRSGRSAALEQRWPTVDQALQWADDLLAGRPLVLEYDPSSVTHGPDHPDEAERADLLDHPLLETPTPKPSTLEV